MSPSLTDLLRFHIFPRLNALFNLHLHLHARRKQLPQNSLPPDGGAGNGSALRVTLVNVDYKKSPTYSRYLCVPRVVKDGQLTVCTFIFIDLLPVSLSVFPSFSLLFFYLFLF